MWVTVCVIFSMTVLLSCVFYELFKSEVLDDLKTYTLELKGIGLFDDASDIKEMNSFMDECYKWSGRTDGIKYLKSPGYQKSACSNIVLDDLPPVKTDYDLFFPWQA